ncbi:hypothetical protein QTP86_033910, partial [Hemibagrus guttatus]
MASAWISACLVDISSWMTAHELKLNPSKTELLVIPGDPSPVQDLAISLNNSMISPSATARNLGETVRQCLYHIRCLKDFKLPSKVLRSFYICTTESIQTGSIISWFGKSTKQDRWISR